MTREDFVLAALSAGNGASHTPVQVQKLLFLLDAKAGELIGGPYFKFAPYDYGPFDAEVYRVLESLENHGFVAIARSPDLRWRTYSTTPVGLKKGWTILEEMDGRASDYLRRLSIWVRSVSFADLVSAVYREYPDMKVNSVFNG